MGQLRIKLLGQYAIQHDGRPLDELSTKAAEMLCYLFLHRDRPHTRETLAEVLWADIPAERAQKYFRQTLWQLQSALNGKPDGERGEGAGLILLGPGWLRINAEADWWLDVDILERAYSLCLSSDVAALSDAQAQTLELAAELYDGDLLATWDHDWCIYERERLQLIYLAIMDYLMSFCEARRAYARGVAFGQRILRYDPARESTYCQLMRLHYLAGDRTTALREYGRCVAALAREFGMPPAQQTVALYEQIRADRREEVAALSGLSTATVARGDAHPAELHMRIERLQASLAAFQSHVQQELAALRQLLRQQQTPQQTSRETP